VHDRSGGGLVATGEDYNLHLGASGTWVIHPADAGVDAGAPGSAPDIDSIRGGVQIGQGLSAWALRTKYGS
jgi:hypothetical protein